MSYSQLLRAPRTIARADPAQVARFADVPVGNIVDAMGRTGALAAPVKPITSANRFAGSALPIDAGPRDNLAPWAALRLAQPGDVMMISTIAYQGGSVCGDLLIGMAKNAGVVAVVTDGAVRDRTGADSVGIPVFATGISPNSPQKSGAGSVGLPIVMSGVAVAAGDIVCGDEDGVVVVPSNRATVVEATLAAIRDKESQMEAEVASGATAPGWLRGLELDEIFTFVD